jgi:integrase
LITLWCTYIWAALSPYDGLPLAGAPNLPTYRMNAWAAAAHHAALPYVEVPAFILKLHGEGEPTIADLAFEFLVLTAARTNEVLEAKWSEIDLKQAAWTAPAKPHESGQRASGLLGTTLQ